VPFGMVDCQLMASPAMDADLGCSRFGPHTAENHGCRR
jgi:hypothetical protein